MAVREIKEQPQLKKQWVKPLLSMHGSVEKLTKQYKQFGADDGITYDGTAIGDVS